MITRVLSNKWIYVTEQVGQDLQRAYVCPPFGSG